MKIINSHSPRHEVALKREREKRKSPFQSGFSVRAQEKKRNTPIFYYFIGKSLLKREKEKKRTRVRERVREREKREI